MLSLANVADASGRVERTRLSLRLLDGLDHTEGHGMAWRVGRQLLAEAAASDPGMGWRAAQMVAGNGTVGWDGIVDALLRGMVRRNPAMASIALTVWIGIGLPWYAEPHGSTTPTGRFLEYVIAAAKPNQVVEFETRVAAAIETRARPDERGRLLGILQDAARARGHGSAAHAAALRVEAGASPLDGNPENRDYRAILDLPGIKAAIASERVGREAHAGGRPVPSYDRALTYGLREATARVVASTDWEAVRSFCGDHPDLAADRLVALALGRRAMAEGNEPAARVFLAPILAEEEDGWSWPNGRGRSRRLEVALLLGEPDAARAAQQAFSIDMAQSRYAITTTVWEIDKLFPLLFGDVPWPRLWSVLEDQIRLYRDYRLGEDLPDADGPGSDEELVAQLLIWALTMGVPLVHAEAARTARTLLDNNEDAIVNRAVDCLVSTGGENRMIGMDLLTYAVDRPAIEQAWRERLPALTNDQDGGVVAAAIFVGNQWNIPLQPTARELPAVYQLHLPDTVHVTEVSAADQQTRGMVIEDPLAWTAPWMALVGFIAKETDTPPNQLRHRVGQLIRSWGGVEQFGHQGSQRLLNKLRTLQMKLTYARPQSVAVLRAFRHVLGELTAARRIDRRAWNFTLHKLRVLPVRPMLPQSERRPPHIQLPVIPESLWGDRQREWHHAASGALSVGGEPEDYSVVAEWRRLTSHHIRVTRIVESWRAGGRDHRQWADLETLLHNLPGLSIVGNALRISRDGDEPAHHVMRLDPAAYDGQPSEFLIFCLDTAETLGWSPDRTAQHIYRDAQGQCMAWTIWWRDGLPQQVEEDGLWAEGQRVVLSPTGLAQFEAMFGPVRLRMSAWRRIVANPNDGGTGGTFATEPDILGSVSPMAGDTLALAPAIPVTEDHTPLSDGKSSVRP